MVSLLLKKASLVNYVKLTSEGVVMSKITLLSEAIVCENKKFDLKSKIFNGGVLNSDGEVCELSIHFKPGYINQPSTDTEKTHWENAKGSWLFGGMLQNGHFGHFITESLNRLWALPHLNNINGIIFYSRYCGERNKQFIYDFLEFLAPKYEVKIITVPCQVENLYVPEQLHCGNGFISGGELNKKLFSNFNLACTEKLKTYDKVYITRAALTSTEGNVVGNDKVAKLLEKQGYTTIYPEKLSLLEQVSIYKYAKKLIFDQGSAFHMYNLFGNDEQDVYVIWRRKKVINGYLLQYRSFFNKELNNQSHIMKQFVPAIHISNTAKFFGIPNINDLYEDLYTLGFLDSKPTHEYLDSEAELALLESKFGDMSEVL